MNNISGETSNMGSARTVSNSGHLVDYEFVPAVVIENDDPMHYGRIKVSAPGVFNTNNAKLEQIPWCYPFTMLGNQSYMTLEKGSKVWLFRNKKRHDENWFIPMYELHENQQRFINENSNNSPEIISYRSASGKSSAITYDKDRGYNMTTGDSSVNVGSGSSATVTGGSSSVVVDNTKVSIGATDSSNKEPAVLGNKLKKVLNDITSNIKEFADEINPNSDLTGPAFRLSAGMHNVIDDIEKILSESVEICEK